ncbi:hypothetical protein [Micromonospora sp. WMMD987]|uniref:hypothetical protein n=1 Tax=Micromonospora sp. WMMD987 TaxID=3016089 RepID=UPI00249CC6F0|nr:hypothetical protein [Micromonospora sp. WMMD987]WFE93339.1 hypothetical protein O7612_18170 [Micromonospora sp. WMMD987]
MTTIPYVPLARYAARLHADIGDRHHVASPLGVWLLLALAAPAATGADRAELADVLGVDAETAAATAAALLDRPHPLVASATAVWHRPGADSGRLAGWRDGLPRATTTGPLPDQAGLDAWAREHTHGLVDRFPLTVSPRVLLALASALATRISWATPFDLVPGAALGPDPDAPDHPADDPGTDRAGGDPAADPTGGDPGAERPGGGPGRPAGDDGAGRTGPAWAGRLTRALRTPEHGHRVWIASTGAAGEVAVHAAPAVERDGAGLVVLSIVADPTVSPADVLAAGYELAGAAVDGEPARRSLFDLPLGAGPLGTLREERVRTSARDGREERHHAVLPCWSARDEHDLTATGPGFPAVARALGGLLGTGVGVEARQAAVAHYGRYGFEAAAVTGAFALVSFPPEGLRRTAELRFGHPYAVLAVATDHRDGGTGPWHGVPVFSAWVATPREPAGADLADPPEPA